MILNDYILPKDYITGYQYQASDVTTDPDVELIQVNDSVQIGDIYP